MTAAEEEYADLVGGSDLLSDVRKHYPEVGMDRSTYNPSHSGKKL